MNERTLDERRSEQNDLTGSFDYPLGTRGFLGLRIAQYTLITIVGFMTARALGPEGRTEFIVPLTIAGIVWGISHLTLSEAIGRLMGRGRLTAVEAAQTLTAAMGLLSVVGLALYAVSYVLLGSRVFGNGDALTVALAGLSIPPTMAASYASDLLVRIGGLIDSGLGVLLGGLLQVTTITVAYLFDLVSPALVIGSAVLSVAASAGFMAMRLQGRLGRGVLNPRLQSRSLRNALRIGVSLHAGSLALQLGTRIDLLVVSIIFNAEETGLYSLSLVLADSAFLLCRTLAELGLPAQTQADERAAIAQTTALVRISVRLGVALGLVGAISSIFLIPVVFGGEWRGSVGPLMALLAAAGAFGAVNPIRTLLARTHRPRQLSELAIAALVTNVVFTVVLGSIFGLIGAAAASTLAYWLYAAALLRIMRRASAGGQQADSALTELPHIASVIVGAQKAATTSLKHYLTQHPEIRSHAQTECSYFSEPAEYELGFEEAHRRYFEDGALGFGPQAKILVAKYAVAYAQPQTLRRIHDHNPDCSIIFVLRDPVERAWSSYRMERLFGLSQPEFKELIPALLSPEGELNHPDEFRMYIDYGHYAVHLESIMSIFPAKAVHLLRFECLAPSAGSVLAQTLGVLGADPGFRMDMSERFNVGADRRSRYMARFIGSMFHWQGFAQRVGRGSRGQQIRRRLGRSLRSLNSQPAPGAEMPDETYRLLADYYAPLNARLGAMTGDDYSDWGRRSR